MRRLELNKIDYYYGPNLESLDCVRINIKDLIYIFDTDLVWRMQLIII